MASDKEEIFIVSKLKTYCSKLKAGIICDDSEMQRAVIINHVNDYIDWVGETTICEGVSEITSPSIACIDSSPTLLPDNSDLVLGDPVIEAAMEILYGYYEILNGTPTTFMTVQDAADDIAANLLTHYATTPWVPAGTAINISFPLNVNPYICYHLIRIPDTIGAIRIKDAGDVYVENDWTKFTDGTYTYYVLKKAIAPSDVPYTLILK